MAQTTSLARCSSAPSASDASGLVQVQVDVLNGYPTYKKPNVAQMPPILEEPHRAVVDSEVQDLWKVVKELQKTQEDMLQKLQKTCGSHKSIEERLGGLDSEMAEIRQKVFSVQELKVTDALDYAEAEVQDLRASLEKIQERQELDASKVQQQQVLLLEQMKQVKNLQTSHEQQCTEVQQVLHQYANESPRHMDKRGALSPGGLCALRAQVDMIETKLMADLETKWVTAQSRIARKESENTHALHALQSRIDAWEGQQKFISSRDMKCPSQFDTLQDLQAIVDRQLMEEHPETLARDVLLLQRHSAKQAGVTPSFGSVSLL